MALQIGFVALARTTFDIALAQEVTAQARAALAAAGFELVGPQALVTTVDEARDAAERLRDMPLDALVLFQATFADSSMALALVEPIAAPLILWAVPEARTGGRLRLNSFCGINLAAHSLKRNGREYDYLYAAPDASDAVARIRAWAQAGQVYRRLRETRLGRFGDNPTGFEPCRLNAEALQRTFGVEVVQYTLPELFTQVRATSSAAVEPIWQAVQARVQGLEALDAEATRRTLAAYLALRQEAQRAGLAGLAVRCWPEFFTELGCAACGAMSMLSDEKTPCSCEADINGTVTQLVLQWLSGEPAFGTDVVGFDDAENAAVLWHCGLAPLSMADPEVTPRGTIHSNRKLPLLMEFPLKPGVVTVARLHEGPQGWQLVVGRGEMLRSPLSFSGTSGVLRFERPIREVRDTIITQGLDHHIGITYGDVTEPLFRLAQLWKIEVIHL